MITTFFRVLRMRALPYCVKRVLCPHFLRTFYALKKGFLHAEYDMAYLKYE